VRRQIAQDTPLRQIHGATHNVFEFSDPDNFRRETYVGIANGARQIAERENLTFKAATLADLADAYREAVPLSTASATELKLDTRGRSFSKS